MNKQSNQRRQPLHGSLKGTTAITIQFATKAVLSIWNGRGRTNKTHSILGAPTLFNNINIMHYCIVNNDPYADYFLYKIEQAIEEKLLIIKDKIEEIDAFSDKHIPPSMIVKETDVFNGYEIKMVDVASKLAFKYVFLLLEADKYMKKVLFLNYIALIDNQKKMEIVSSTQKSLRSIIYLTLDYKATGVTRNCIAANNQIAQSAIDKMGHLEEPFLHATLRATTAPRIANDQSIKTEKEPDKSSLNDGQNQPDTSDDQPALSFSQDNSDDLLTASNS